MTNAAARLSPGAPPRTLTGRHVAALLAVFFGVTIAVNLTMAVLANKTWSGLLVANTYVESQRYNGHIAKARAEAALGWQAEIATDGGRLELRLSDADGAALFATDVAAIARRAVTEDADVDLRFFRIAGGRYRADRVLAGGAWNVEIVVTRGPDSATFRHRLVVDASPGPAR